MKTADYIALNTNKLTGEMCSPIQTLLLRWHFIINVLHGETQKEF